MGNPILIVDGSDCCRRLMKYVLAVFHIQATTAPDARSAWRAIESCTPSLVVLDIVLPDTDGLEFVRAVKARGIAAIAVTGRAMAEDRKRALEAGCVDYVAKPIDTRTIANVVMHQLTARTTVT